jgi:hypothetical protein
MTTEQLIDLLARGAGPAPRGLAPKRIGAAVGVGLLASVSLTFLIFGAAAPGPATTAALGIKLLYAGLLAVATAWLSLRLGRPAARTAPPVRAVIAIVGTMALLATGAWLATQPDQQASELYGRTWTACPRNIFCLAIPALIAALWALKSLAPTRPGLAGFSAGLMAGSIGALGYMLACPETSIVFIAIWYSTGIAMTSLLGAAVGSRVLRW